MFNNVFHDIMQVTTQNKVILILLYLSSDMKTAKGNKTKLAKLFDFTSTLGLLHLR